MLIDWFTVGAQVLNFLVLVWLLKRFLYKPVLDAIDAREKGIASRLAEAQVKLTDAATQQAQYTQKSQVFDQERAALLQQATAAAATERQRLIDVARQAADDLKAKRQNALVTEQLALKLEIGRRTGAEVMAIVRKTLADLAGASLEEQIVAAFMARLQTLGDPRRQQLVAAIQAAQSAGSPIQVRSAFELATPQRSAIQAALNALVTDPVMLHFESAPALIGGIELNAGGWKLAWSITQYLGGLEKSIAALLAEKTRDAAPAPAPTAPAKPAAPPLPAAPVAAP
ncbi:MAG: F0F1 ATP synthase subunit delta [Herminiimonas sp.]|nr:F0F1 ATP synthase subunit delta [Herminiimonas sp.]